MELATGSRRQQAATRREQILESALQVFAEKGYAGASIRDIARKVGVTEGLIYHYFDGKAHLMYSCWSERAWQANLERILADAENTPLLQALEALVVELLNTLREQADIVQLWTNEMQHDEEMQETYLKRMEQTRRLIADFVRARQQTGEVRADADVDTATSLLLSSAMSQFTLYGRSEDEFWKGIVSTFPHRCVSLLLHGIAA